VKGTKALFAKAMANADRGPCAWIAIQTGDAGRVTVDRSSEVSRSDVCWQADHRNVVNQLIAE
jgi:hypothetical protein